jgi:hypothetical protein
MVLKGASLSGFGSGITGSTPVFCTMLRLVAEVL